MPGNAPTHPADPPTTDASPGDAALRAEVRMLGIELGHVLKQHGSDGLYDLVEEVRALAKRRREGDPDADAALTGRIASLTDDQLGELIRALSSFFDLANLAEDRHRVRVLRERERAAGDAPRGQSLGAAIHRLAERGLTAEQVQSLLRRLEVDLVFTAHPTEAKRRTVRTTLGRLRADLADLDREDALTRERDESLRRIKADLDCLWETETLRPTRPTVLDEVDRSLFVADSLWKVVPWLMRGTREALRDAYPSDTPTLRGAVRFGTWIGGDRDGNPFVTPEVTRQTLVKLRRAIIDKHLDQCLRLEQKLSISEKHHPVSAQLVAMIDTADRWPETAAAVGKAHPRERYRQALRIIHARLAAAALCDPVDGGPDAGYPDADALLADLRTIADSLRANGHDELAEGEVRDWIDRAEVFGLHLARLDIREDSQQLHSAIGEVLAQVHGSASPYADLDEQAKQTTLTAPIDRAAAAALDLEQVTEPTRNTVELFVLLQRAAQHYGQDALGELIVSMTHHPSDVLAMLFLGRLAAALLKLDGPTAVLPAVPLFETIDDLRDADQTLDELLTCPPYRQHVHATGNTQTCMVGYSDSCKDGGFLASNWRLYDAQRRLADTAQQHNVKLVLFHGRGGSLGRGGGPAARGVLSLPPEAVNHRIRITEQGEVLAERYDDPAIAFRHVEQVCWATLLVSNETSKKIDPSWADALDRATAASIDRYRALRDDDAFLAYFDKATPINTIETLPIGSRPSRRRGQRELKNLRAIPYTFAWTQNRHLLTAWFGLGTGLNTIDPDTRRAMYHGWPMFQGMLHNAELALTKCDMDIARHYANLAAQGDDGAGCAVLFDTIRDEFDLTRKLLLDTTGQPELLAGIPWLQRSIRVRNPYIDPLNLIQVELMRRGRDPQGDLLRLSVQAIAAGLRTTG